MPTPSNLIAFRAAPRTPPPGFAPANSDAAPAATTPPPGFRPAGSAPAGAAPDGFVRAGASAPDALAMLDSFEAPAAPANLNRADGVVADPLPEKLDRPMLLFNSLCEVCQVLSAWVKEQDNGGGDLIDERPIPDDPETLKKLNPNLDIWKVYEEIHLLMPDGTIKTGGEAVGEVLKRLPATKWAAWLVDVGIGPVKPFQWGLNGAYKFLDAIRPALGCKSCGGGPVAWWAKPIKWGADLVKLVRGADAPAEQPAVTPS